MATTATKRQVAMSKKPNTATREELNRAFGKTQTIKAISPKASSVAKAKRAQAKKGK